jgi:hypothetical protein
LAEGLSEPVIQAVEALIPAGRKRRRAAETSDIEMIAHFGFVLPK